jgi:hypothetical protein
MNKQDKAVADQFRKQFAPLIARFDVTDVVVAGDYIYVLFAGCAALHSAHCAR